MPEALSLLYKVGERRAYWALVESLRTERGSRQNVVAWLGASKNVYSFGSKLFERKGFIDRGI